MGKPVFCPKFCQVGCCRFQSSHGQFGCQYTDRAAQRRLDQQRLLRIFVPGSGTVRLTGTSGPAAIGGSDSTIFYNLRSDKAGTETQLGRTVHVSNEAELINGDIYLGNHKLDLLGTGTLLGETYPAGLRAYCNDNESGRIRAVRTLNPGANANIAGLGMFITVNGSSPGSTVLVRGHDRQTSTTPNGQTGIGRFLDIYPTNYSGYTYNFLFQYHENELYGMPEEWFVFYRSPSHAANTADWEEWGAGHGYGSPGWPDIQGLAVHDAAQNHVILSGINTFSRWTVSNQVVNPLPVVLLSFTGECAEGKVILRWTTASELNNDYFRVERSADLQSWETLGTVNGAGNSNAPLTYTLTDDRPENGLTYYRLTQVDFNGDSETFESIAVACQPAGSADNDMTVYPNPADDRFTVRIRMSHTVNGAVLEFTDMNGKRMLNRNVNLTEGENEFAFDRWMLNPGAYVILLRGENLSLKPVKLIIQ